jgi:SAM-dependent methyltransferase
VSEPAGEHWDRVFREKADDETSWYEPTPDQSLSMLDRLAVGPDASVVDVGAGRSRIVDALVSRGHDDVSVLDVSAESLARSQRRLGERAEQVEWIVADVRTWQPHRRYDVWHDRAVFHFLTEPDDRAAYRDVLRSALTPGGVLIVATFAPSGPTHCSGLPVTRYGPDDLAEVLGPDLLVLDEREVSHTTPWGKPQPFTWFAARLT